MPKVNTTTSVASSYRKSSLRRAEPSSPVWLHQGRSQEPAYRRSRAQATRSTSPLVEMADPRATADESAFRKHHGASQGTTEVSMPAGAVAERKTTPRKAVPYTKRTSETYDIRRKLQTFVLVLEKKTKRPLTTYDSYMNPEPGFQSGPGDSVDAD